MDMYQKIDADMKNAMRQKDVLTLSVLRMALSSIKNTEISKKVAKLDDADIAQIIQKMIKEHKDSIEQFGKGGRQDLVDKETKELKILQSYLPQQLTEDELLAVVKKTIEETGATTKAETGKVMKAVMEKTKGRAEGKVVNQLVMGLLK